MTDKDMQALEFFQTSCEGRAERRLRDLADAVDDLTTLAQSREGIHSIKAGRNELLTVLLKLHDLVLETQPMEKVA